MLGIKMKNISKFSIYLLAGLLLPTYSSTKAVQKDQKSTVVQQEESSWSRFTASIAAFFYSKQNPSEKKSKKIKNKDVAVQPIKNLSRAQAIEEIRKLTTNFFDPNDKSHITLHLNNMKEFSNFLHEVEDKKLIAAIHFLLENYEKTGMAYLAFWIQASQRLELDTIFPMTPEIAKKTKAEKLKILSKKMATNS
jgi:hypothetical protein